MVVALAPVMMALNAHGVQSALPIASGLVADGLTSISALKSAKVLSQSKQRNRVSQELNEMRNSNAQVPNANQLRLIVIRIQ